MTELSNAIRRTRDIASNGFRRPMTTIPAVHRAFASLDLGVANVDELKDLEEFLGQCAAEGVRHLTRLSLNRVLRGAWLYEDFETLALDAAEKAQAEGRASSDRAIIEGYLIAFPEGREVLPRLARLAADAAARKPETWGARSEALKLFDPIEGPKKLGDRLVDPLQPPPSKVLEEAGLGATPFTTAFARAAFREACFITANKPPVEAEGSQERLLQILSEEKVLAKPNWVVCALLQPWVSQKPEPEHRKAITDLLLDRIGDPRVERRKWSPISDSIAETHGVDRAEEIIGVLRRWLADAAMRIFFRAIHETTDRKDMWSDRENFWLAYLDAGIISDAWPALGPRARRQMQDLARQSGEQFEFGEIAEGPPGSSALIMQIGDTRIAEWSDSGMCRFWNVSDPMAPAPYARRYYDKRFRVTTGQGAGFEAHRHDVSAGNPIWAPRFARVIYRRTGIEHPKLKRG